jgi:hypothetical protein
MRSDLVYKLCADLTECECEFMLGRLLEPQQPQLVAKWSTVTLRAERYLMSTTLQIKPQDQTSGRWLPVAVAGDVLTHGCHYFEVTLDNCQCSSLMLGVLKSDKANALGLHYTTTNSAWCLNTWTGGLNGNGMDDHYCTGGFKHGSFKVGDRIGMLLDLDQSAPQLLFYRNGKQLGPGYDGVDDRAPIEGPVVFFVESHLQGAGARLSISQHPYRAPLAFEVHAVMMDGTSVDVRLRQGASVLHLKQRLATQVGHSAHAMVVFRCKRTHARPATNT